jgi:putative endopeptidase
VIVQQPSFFEGLDSILKNFDAQSWKAWLKWRIISGAAPYLSSEFVNQNFEFYGKTLSGTPELRERWKRAVSLIEGSLGEAVGKVYVEKYFPAEAKKRMEELVANLIQAYEVSIKELPWMGPETKVKALEKIANSLDALTIWFEEIDKQEWSDRIQYYLSEWHKTTKPKDPTIDG